MYCKHSRIGHLEPEQTDPADAERIGGSRHKDAEIKKSWCSKTMELTQKAKTIVAEAAQAEEIDGGRKQRSIGTGR